LTTDLDLDVRLRLDVEVPAGVIVRPSVGGDEQVVVPVARVDEAVDARVPGLPAGGVQEQTRHAEGLVSEATAALLVERVVDAEHLLSYSHARKPTGAAKRCATRSPRPAPAAS